MFYRHRVRLHAVITSSKRGKNLKPEVSFSSVDVMAQKAESSQWPSQDRVPRVLHPARQGQVRLALQTSLLGHETSAWEVLLEGKLETQKLSAGKTDLSLASVHGRS